jgi:hypothetical protein
MGSTPHVPERRSFLPRPGAGSGAVPGTACPGKHRPDLWGVSGRFGLLRSDTWPSWPIPMVGWPSFAPVGWPSFALVGWPSFAHRGLARFRLRPARFATPVRERPAAPVWRGPSHRHRDGLRAVPTADRPHLSRPALPPAPDRQPGDSRTGRDLALTRTRDSAETGTARIAIPATLGDIHNTRRHRAIDGQEPLAIDRVRDSRRIPGLSGRHQGPAETTARVRQVSRSASAILAKTPVTWATFPR